MSSRLKNWTKGANRSQSSYGTADAYMTAGLIRSLGLNRSRIAGVPKDRYRVKNPKRVAQALGTAKGLMGSEKTMRRIRAEAQERHALDVPKGHKRIRRTDPVTGEVHTLDLPIPPGKAFDRLLDALRYAGDPFKWAPALRTWQLEFIRTGRYCPD